MSDDLTQIEADLLLAQSKHRLSDETVKIPGLGGKVSIDLQSQDGREKFLLDMNRSYVSLSKLTLQTRARVTVVLARLDVDGAPHRNPDDTEILCPHLHLYREGFGDKWAFPVPSDRFGNLSDRWETIQDFMKFCCIVDPPNLVRDLLS
jgi:hypothetical protein